MFFLVLKMRPRKGIQGDRLETYNGYFSGTKDDHKMFKTLSRGI